MKPPLGSHGLIPPALRHHASLRGKWRAAPSERSFLCRPVKLKAAGVLCSQPWTPTRSCPRPGLPVPPAPGWGVHAPSCIRVLSLRGLWVSTSRAAHVAAVLVLMAGGVGGVRPWGRAGPTPTVHGRLALSDPSGHQGPTGLESELAFWGTFLGLRLEPRALLAQCWGHLTFLGRTPTRPPSLRPGHLFLEGSQRKARVLIGHFSCFHSFRLFWAEPVGLDFRSPLKGQ